MCLVLFTYSLLFFIYFLDVEDGNHDQSLTIAHQRGVNITEKPWKYDMTGMKKKSLKNIFKFTYLFLFFFKKV